MRLFVLLFFTGAPSIKQCDSARLVKPVGEPEVKLLCNVKDGQTSTYAWYKDGVRISQTFEPARYSVKTYRFLKITDIVKSDSGVFVCVTSNSHGSANCTIEFLVEGKNVF